MGLLAIDTTAGFFYHTGTDPEIIVSGPRAAPALDALVVFPGYGSDGASISEAFGPLMASQEALLVVSYPQRGMNDAAIYEAVMSALADISPSRIEILGGSMGGLAAIRFLGRYLDDGRPLPYGRAKLVLDTVPAGEADVRRPEWLFRLSTWYRGGPLSSACWAALSQLSPHPSPEYGADEKAITLGNRANAWIGTPALTTQAAYIAAFDLDDAVRIQPTLESVRFLSGASPDDPLIRVDDAISRWRIIFPQLQVSSISTRNADWHIPWTYRPAETLAAATGS